MINPVLDYLFRFIALSLFIYWQFYWFITEKDADRAKPKAPITHKVWFLRRISSGILGLLLGLQLLGLPLFPFGFSPFVLYVLQIIGVAFVIAGVSIAISARKTLGTNWAHAYEYQIKQKQELVTEGVYRMIRHPIYTGLILGVLGGELVAGSYLVCGVLILTPYGYIQAKREEKILVAHFGEVYKNYMKRSKKFLPYLW